MSGLVYHLFRRAAHCKEKWPSSRAKNLDKILPENVFIVLHCCKSFIGFGVNVDFVLRLCLVAILVSLGIFDVWLVIVCRRLLIRGLSLYLSILGIVCFIKWLKAKIWCNRIVVVILGLISVFLKML